MSEWISVEDSLPDSQDFYLVWMGRDNVQLAFFDRYCDWIGDPLTDAIYPKYWARIPEQPKE